MTEFPATPSRRGARTFRAACAVLASVAVAQAAATAWSARTVVAGADASPVGPVEVAAKPKILDPFSSSYTPDDPHPEMQTGAGEAPPNDPALALLRPEPVISIPKPTPAPLDVAITDEAVLADLDEGLYLRSRGEMLGAVTKLRAALQKLPDHPRLLYHTARILDVMGQPKKAEPHWKALHRLGKGAGDFFTLAQERMAEGPQAAEEPEEEKEGKFTITDLRDEPVPDAQHGERVRFTAVLKKQPSEPVVLETLGDDMMLAPHFFDSVNGRRIARSQVLQPVLECLSPPLDWKEETETFTFDYWQPAMTPEEVLKYGRCKYFGCTLEVYYKNKLQDNTATTPVLLHYARELPVPEPEALESILDAGPVPVPGRQPEAGLFPPQLKP